MNRVRHMVLDRQREVRATMVLPEGEVFDPPPWIRHKVTTAGWTILSEAHAPPGINDHGHVNWYEVAQHLADALRPHEEEPDAAEALGLFDIALAEVALARAGTEQADPAEQPGDG